MKRHGKLHINDWPHSEFRRTALLSILCAIGILLGSFTARHVSAQTSTELQSYLNTYIHLPDHLLGGSEVLRAFVVYFRYCLLVLFFSFSAAGIYLIPLLLALQGFSLAFSISLFFRSAGGILPVLVLFAIRCLFVLPTTLYCSGAAIRCAVCGKESRDRNFWSRFAVSVLILLIGTILEISVVPRLFALVYPI